MKVDRVICYGSVERMQSNGLKAWIKAGFEAAIEEDENHIECYRKLKDDLKTALGSEEVSFYQSIEESLLSRGLYKEYATSIKYIKAEEIEIAIDNATSLHELDLLMGDAAKYNLAKQLIEKRNKLKEQ